MPDYLYEIRADEAQEAMEIANTVRMHVGMMAPIVDDKPGRNLRWETGREIDRLSSIISDKHRAGRVLIALSLELQDEYGLAFTNTPETQRALQRKAWEDRLRNLGVTAPQ